MKERVYRRRTGFSGLEIAAIIGCFAALVAGFIYFVLSTGILTAEKTREALLQGVEQTTGPVLALHGTVTGQASPDQTALFRLRFQMTNLTPEIGGVDLSGRAVTLTYTDKDQHRIMSPYDWVATWKVGEGSVLNWGERVELIVDLRSLDPNLGPSKRFTIQVIPTEGEPLSISKNTPPRFSEMVQIP